MKTNKSFPNFKGIMISTILLNKKISIMMLLFILGASVVQLIPPLLLEQIVNNLTKKQAIQMEMAALYFIILVIAGTLEAAKAVFITMFGQKITHQIRSVMGDKLSRLPSAYYTMNEAGALTSRFVNDVDTVEALFDQGIISLFADLCTVFGIFAVILYKVKGLAILLLVILPMLLYLTRRFQKWMLKAQKENRNAVARVNRYIPETIQNIRMIRSFYKQNYMEHRYDQVLEKGYRSMEKANLYDSVYSPIIIMISTATTAVVMLFAAAGGQNAVLFGMSAGTATALISYISKIFGPLESIGMEIQNIQSTVAGVSRIEEFLAEEEREIPAQKEFQNEISVCNVEQDTPVLQMLNVCFGYRVNQEIVHNLSLQVFKGDNLVLTGRTGIGKSTIFRLLLGLYKPDSGEIRIFGIPAAFIQETDRRKYFGYVEQEFHPVRGTIEEQITLYDSRITRNQVKKAAKMVGISKLIEKMPKGYDTIFSKELFSQGQLQLLSIARAVAFEPYIMLLDEITANLDSETELQVMEAIQAAGRDRTVISISHRVKNNKGDCVCFQDALV